MSRLSIVMVSAAVVLTGCSVGGPDARSGATATSPPPPVATEPAEPDATAGPDEAPPVEEAGCTVEEQDGIDATIAGQLDAFAVGDYARALTFASEGFRAGLDAEAFERVIRQGFPVVARDADHRTRRCVTLAGEGGVAAQALVTVTAADGETIDLVYLLLIEDDRWAISGATPTVPVDDESEAVVT